MGYAKNMFWPHAGKKFLWPVFKECGRASDIYEFVAVPRPQVTEDMVSDLRAEAAREREATHKVC